MRRRASRTPWAALLNHALDEDPWHADAAAALGDLRARREGGPVPDPAAIALEVKGG
jgi:hypothetical protein